MSRPKLTTLIVAATLLPGQVHAGGTFRAVWYPDGEITFHIADDAEGARTAITDAMTFMVDHTPLEVTETQSESGANLHFEATWLSPNGGGYTNGYWDENHSDSNKKIRFDPDHLPGRDTVAHEFGHALGFPHEFQRPNRDAHVDVCFNTDPYNYSPAGSAFWPDPYQELSVYDFASVMNDGYSSCVTPLPGQNLQDRDYEGRENLLSVHDINSIYRVYGKNLGANNAGDRFGVAVASGDYDDDGFKDVAVANVQSGGLWLSFYRGVGTAAAEGVDGIKFAPWFKVEHQEDVDDDSRVALATGDFNGDGIDDLAVGQPDYDSGRGLVSILFVNSLRTDPDKDDLEGDFAPWGRKGVQYRIDIYPGHVGLAAPFVYPQFGASLAAIRGTNFRDEDGDPVYHDLVIGAPRARIWNAVNSASKGAVAIIKGGVDTSPADFSTATYQVIWSPVNAIGDFGAAVTALPGRCYTAFGQTSKYYTDQLAVGAPGFSDGDGAVYTSGCLTTGSGSTLTAPAVSLAAYATNGSLSRFGHSLAGFRTFTGVYRHTYLAIGEPEFLAADGKRVGRALVYEFDPAMTFVAQFVPSIHDGGDDFGQALAVQQHPYSDTVTDEGDMTYVAIGMPGAKIGGVRAGKVMVWRPLYDPGVASVVEANDPDSSTNTRFGESIAALRPLKDVGGFVVGAPDAIVDGVQAGQVSTLQNDAGSAGWQTIRRNLDQETDGDVRPTN
jgi:hypothetical protein